MINALAVSVGVGIAARRKITTKTVDADMNEVRFTAVWGGSMRYVFIPDPYVSNDAGHVVTCRDEAVAFVEKHLEQYTAEARAQHGDDSCERIVVLNRS